MKRERYYTVIGYYPDQFEPWMGWIKAENPKKAARKAIRYNRASCGLAVVEVVLGRVKGCLENEEIVFK